MRLVLAIVVTLFGCPAWAGATLTVRGDRLWVEDHTCPKGWQLRDFDDSAWLPVPYPWTRIWPIDWPLDPRARPIWGTAARPVNCLRRTFALAVLPSPPAILHIWVDDDYDLFLNGIPVGSSRDGHGELPGESYDVTPLLRRGDNVVAVQVRDNGGVMGMLLSLQLSGLPAPRLRTADVIDVVLPWFAFALVLVAAIAAIARSRRAVMHLAPRMACLPVSSVLGATIVLGSLLQAVFSCATFYRSHREMPLAEWSWFWLAVVAAIFAALAVVRARPEREAGVEVAPAHEGWWLAGVLLLALALRSYQLDAVPPGFFQDEATNGNDALLLGRMNGPVLWSESIGGRPTLFLYLLLAALEIFGSSYLSLKVVPVAVGVAGVAALYALGRVAFGPATALWAAFLLAVSRWDVHYSRMAWEAICVPLFASAGFALLVAGLRSDRRSPSSILASAVLLAAGLYTYAAYRAIPAVVAVFVLAMLWSPQRDAIRRRWMALSFAAAAAFAVAAPLLLFVWRQPDLYWYRYREVALTRFILYYQAPEAWLHQLGKGLLALTAVGDEIVRHNLPGAAHLDPLTSGLLLIGMAAAFCLRSHTGLRLAWCWLIVFAALATLTMDGPHATRLLGLAPAAMLFAAFGMTELLADTRRWRPASQPLLAGGMAVCIAAVNVYQYFVVHANHPLADSEYNLTGRSVCEYLRQQDDAVDVRWTSDVGYWSDGQCQFLARGKYDLGDGVRPEDLLSGGGFDNPARPTVVIIGREFLARHADVIARDAFTGVPLLALPGSPLVGRDRRGDPLYYLYRIGENDEPPPDGRGS